MAGAQYLKRRASGIYFVRLCVPARLKAAVGKGEVHRSTGSRELRVAKIVAAELSAQWHRSLEKLSRMDVEKVATGSVDLLGEGLVSIERAAKALGTTALELARQLLDQGARMMVEAREWNGWLLDDIWKLDHDYDDAGNSTVDVSETALAQVGIRRVLTQTLALRHAEEAIATMAVGGASVCQFMLPRTIDRAFIVPLPGVELSAGDILVQRIDVERLRTRLAEAVTPEMMELARSQRPISVPNDLGNAKPKAAMKTVAEVVEEYLRRKRPTWRPSTQLLNDEACQLLVDLGGASRLSEVERPWLVGLADQIKELPMNRHLVRQKLSTGATCMDLISFAQQAGLPRLTPSGVTKVVTIWGSVLQWALEQDYLVKNPAMGLAKDVLESMGSRRSKNKRKERDSFSDADLERIFSVAFFTKGAGERTADGQFYSYRPHYYWLPLLGLYAGGRLNELAQLHLSDIKVSEQGVHFLDFNLDASDKVDADKDAGPVDAHGSKALKTVNAERVVPLHPRLIELGFLEYVEALRAAFYTRLFPELQFNRVKGYGKAASSWFNERFLGKQLKIERNGKRTFHSFRHNFSTAAGHVDMEGRVRDQLMGHSRGSSESDKRYDKGRTVEMLREHIARVDYKLPAIGKFDVAAGVEAVRHAMELKSSRRGRRARA